MCDREQYINTIVMNDKDKVMSFGLTKRELFAAMAMREMIPMKWSSATHLANVAVEIADALLERLDQKQ